MPPDQGETGGLYPGLVCLLGFFGQSSCLEIFYDGFRSILAVCLVCLNGIANGGFRDGGVGLHMYRQLYGFFDGEGSAYACQGIDTSIFGSFNFFDRPFGEPL